MTTTAPDSNPAAEYSRRLAARTTALADCRKTENRIANGRLAAFLAGVAVLYGALGRDWFSPVWVALPIAAFGALVVYHARTLLRIRSLESAIQYYERGIARIEDRWFGLGPTGEAFARESHPYAADLDLFGRDSLFALMCTARTTTGSKTLADWLCEPASADTIRSRQGAVAELRGKLDLREHLLADADEVERGVMPEAMIAWSRGAVVFASNAERVRAMALRGLSILTFAIMAVFEWTVVLFALSVVLEWFSGRHTRERIRSVLKALDEPQRELASLLHVLRRFEQEQFECAHLKSLQQRLTTNGQSASRAIDTMYKLTAWHDARGNFLFAIFAALLQWDLHFAYAFERWRLTYGKHLPVWLSAIGELEALCSIAGYAYEHPADPLPDMVDAGPMFQAEQLGHPLLPAAACVRNDVSLGGDTRLLVVSGSNMSGKSTLLRMVGINAALALAGAPVRAKRLRISPLAIGATLRVQDSIQRGNSRFYAEVNRVKQIVDLAQGAIPALFLLDELFAGTNSHDRRQGAEAVLRTLMESNAIGLITTHDLALTEVAAAIGPAARNVHFEDHLENGQLAFDYRMRDGVVTKSNAIALMQAVGLKI